MESVTWRPRRKRQAQPCFTVLSARGDAQRVEPCAHLDLATEPDKLRLQLKESADRSVCAGEWSTLNRHGSIGGRDTLGSGHGVGDVVPVPTRRLPWRGRLRSNPPRALPAHGIDPVFSPQHGRETAGTRNDDKPVENQRPERNDHRKARNNDGSSGARDGYKYNQKLNDAKRLCSNHLFQNSATKCHLTLNMVVSLENYVFNRCRSHSHLPGPNMSTLFIHVGWFSPFLRSTSNSCSFSIRTGQSATSVRPN
jgi:hypothetical protein